MRVTVAAFSIRYLIPKKLTKKHAHLLVSSADNFCNSSNQDQGQTKRLAGSDSKLFDNLMVSLKEIFEKVDLKQSADHKKHQNYPVGK